MAWEYATTSGQRKSWDVDKPEGDGWEPDYSMGRPGEAWDRFEIHEEAYWRRWTGTEPRPQDDPEPYINNLGDRMTIAQASASTQVRHFPIKWMPRRFGRDCAPLSI
jgi:hypothetical protein